MATWGLIKDEADGVIKFQSLSLDLQSGKVEGLTCSGYQYVAVESCSEYVNMIFHHDIDSNQDGEKVLFCRFNIQAWLEVLIKGELTKQLQNTSKVSRRLNAFKDNLFNKKLFPVFLLSSSHDPYAQYKHKQRAEAGEVTWSVTISRGAAKSSHRFDNP